VLQRRRSGYPSSDEAEVAAGPLSAAGGTARNDRPIAPRRDQIVGRSDESGVETFARGTRARVRQSRKGRRALFAAPIPCTCDRRGVSGKRLRCVYDRFIVLSSTPRERVVSRPRSAYLFGFLYARVKYRRVVIIATINCAGLGESRKRAIASYEARGRSSRSSFGFSEFSRASSRTRDLALAGSALGSGRRFYVTTSKAEHCQETSVNGETGTIFVRNQVERMIQ